ncbi:MAG TPA: MBL fold metallo-hydrolase [Candidatus Aquicultor sp.]|jgi:L-ascorbate metabolism protein UlaG (beta-lactamase superfamily)
MAMRIGTAITWLGHACFIIQSSAGLRILTDPYNPKTGYTFPDVTADIVTISHHHTDHDEVGAVKGTPRIIETPIVVTIEDITFDGIPSYHDEALGSKRGANIMFIFSIDGRRIAHMGDFGEESLTKEQFDALNGVDVLMIPVGGNYTIDGTQAAEIAQQVKPKVVIPMHYKTRNSTLQIVGPEAFLANMSDVAKKGSSVEITASTLPKRTEVWLMEYIQ